MTVNTHDVVLQLIWRSKCLEIEKPFNKKKDTKIYIYIYIWRKKIYMKFWNVFCNICCIWTRTLKATFQSTAHSLRYIWHSSKLFVYIWVWHTFYWNNQNDNNNNINKRAIYLVNSASWSEGPLLIFNLTLSKCPFVTTNWQTFLFYLRKYETKKLTLLFLKKNSFIFLSIPHFVILSNCLKENKCSCSIVYQVRKS